jgi:hypothetical protein
MTIIIILSLVLVIVRMLHYRLTLSAALVIEKSQFGKKQFVRYAMFDKRSSITTGSFINTSSAVPLPAKDPTIADTIMNCLADFCSCGYVTQVRS